MLTHRGIYFGWEGGEGAGKSTQSAIFARKFQTEFPGRSVLLTREPGGCNTAEKIRKVLLDLNQEGNLDSMTEAILFAEARHSSLTEVVRPALMNGIDVFSDRTFYSSLAYQGYGRNLGVDVVWELNKDAVGIVRPDLAILIDIDPIEGLKRTANKNREQNRLDLEKLDFHQRVREGFLELAGREPERFMVIDGMLSKEGQAEVIWEGFVDRFPSLETRTEFLVNKERSR